MIINIVRRKENYHWSYCFYSIRSFLSGLIRHYPARFPEWYNLNTHAALNKTEGIIFPTKNMIPEVLGLNILPNTSFVVSWKVIFQNSEVCRIYQNSSLLQTLQNSLKEILSHLTMQLINIELICTNKQEITVWESKL